MAFQGLLALVARAAEAAEVAAGLQDQCRSAADELGRACLRRQDGACEDATADALLEAFASFVRQPKARVPSSDLPDVSEQADALEAADRQLRADADCLAKELADVLASTEAAR